MLPLLSARRWPPPGRAFTGAFLFQDDQLQHLSFVEQASRGAWIFVNKFDLRSQAPFLVNATWWLGGLIARLARLSPIDGYLVLHLIAPGLLVWAAWRALTPDGTDRPHLGWALVLFLTGGGLGWVAAARGRPLAESLDLGTSLFPFMQLLIGPHSVVGTALLLLALVGHARWRVGRAGRAAWLLPACLLGITRPFDLGTFVLVSGGLAAREAVRHGARQALVQVSELLWLLPVLVYDFLVFRLHPSFSPMSGEQNRLPAPGLLPLVLAIGPAVALAALGRRRPSGPEEAEVRVSLLVAAVMTVAVIGSPVPFGLQLLGGLGPVVLLLAALRVAPRHLAVAALLFSPAALVTLWRFCNPPPQWFPPLAYLQVPEALRGRAQEGDVVLADPTFGLFVAALSPCRVVVGHRVLTPDYDRRRAEVGAFFDPRRSASWRREYLGAVGARYVVTRAGDEPALADLRRAWRFSADGAEVWEIDAPRF
jgi:hypothetical protein